MDAKDIFFVGKGDDPDKLEDWMKSVLHPNPRLLKLQIEDMAGLAALSSAVRKFNRPISECIKNIEAAKATALSLVENEKCEETDEVIVALQASVEDMVRDA